MSGGERVCPVPDIRSTPIVECRARDGLATELSKTGTCLAAIYDVEADGQPDFQIEIIEIFGTNDVILKEAGPAQEASARIWSQTRQNGETTVSYLGKPHGSE
ncbi:hypothetical protein [Microvirga sp. P5_D2]